MAECSRRAFLATATTAAVAVASGARSRAAGANDKVVVAVVGANNRGSQLATGFAEEDGLDFAYVCDCDESAIQKGIDAATMHGARAPKGIKDFRYALDDKDVDAVIVATPNHWHALATILACDAGKHVYVEKPISHTADEGERMIAAARRSKSVVQSGLQRRSGPLYQAVVDHVQNGRIGRVLYARSWYLADRPTIGRGKETDPPKTLDYDLWQGPAVVRPYRDNLIHYNWHWFWHWGNGELGNNGVHTIDICRWALGVDFPSKVTASGAKLRFDDDQETPDTCLVDFECNGRTIVWEGISWSRPYQSKSQIGIEFRGEDGTLYVDDGGYTIFDPRGKRIEERQLSRGDKEHRQNFLYAIRSGSRLNAEIEEGHRSTLFCHLGNIAYRTGQTLEIDATNGHIRKNSAAEQLWSSDYRKGWMPSS